jgi:hypothetical protein
MGVGLFCGIRGNGDNHSYGADWCCHKCTLAGGLVKTRQRQGGCVGLAYRFYERAGCVGCRSQLSFLFKPGKKWLRIGVQPSLHSLRDIFLFEQLSNKHGRQDGKIRSLVARVYGLL